MKELEEKTVEGRMIWMKVEGGHKEVRYMKFIELSDVNEYINNAIDSITYEEILELFSKKSINTVHYATIRHYCKEAIVKYKQHLKNKMNE